MTQQYVIGIDGGGTKTIAMIARMDKPVKMQAIAGASNPHTTGFETSASLLLKLIETCCKKAKCNLKDVGKIVIGLAGVGRDEDKKLFLQHLKKKSNASLVKKVILVTDIQIAMEAAFPGQKECIAVIAGTGSIVLHRTSNNKLIRAGGWGRMLGDDGSGFAIGRDGIRETLKEYEGRQVKTTLTKKLKTFFKIVSVEKIISYAAGDSGTIASFAPEVIKAAERGDEVAREILVINALALAEAVETVIAKIKQKKNLPIVFFGSLLEHKNLYSSMVKEVILEMIPNVTIYKPEFSPVYGALSMGINLMILEGAYAK